MDPQSIQQALKSAVALHQAGSLAEAERQYRQVLAWDAGQPYALHYLGLLAYQRGDYAEAERLMGRSNALLPSVPDHHNNLGLLYLATGRGADAEVAFRRALALRGGACPPAQLNLANALQGRGELTEAAAIYRSFLAARPNDPGAHYNLARTLVALRRPDEALPHATFAAANAPTFVDAHVLLGQIRRERQEIRAALDAYAAALRLRPDYGEVHANVAGILRDQGRIEESVAAFRRAVGLRPHSAAIHSALIYTLWFHPDLAPAEIFREHVEWARRHADPLVGEVRPPRRIDLSGGRRLRIGYVSPDLYRHSVGRLIEPALAHHDHARFEIVLYSDVAAPDELTRRIHGHADLVRHTVALSDAQLADQVRNDEIDVLVDLSLHMAGNRLLAFARRPAPVQVTYLAYCATSGLRTMDYCLTDPRLDPPPPGEALVPGDRPGIASPIHTERLLHLPHYWTYRPPEEMPEVGAPPRQRNGCITFGSFNNFAKVNGRVIAAWSEVLRRVPRSRLLIVMKGGRDENPHVAEQFARHGIAADQLDVIPTRGAREYLELHNAVDVCLDPFPYNGGTTTLDALCMGVPVVTVRGDRATGRAGATLLHSADCPNLVADDLRHYLDVAVGLAEGLSGPGEEATSVRRALRDRVMQGPVANAASFARGLQGQYRLAVASPSLPTAPGYPQCAQD